MISHVFCDMDGVLCDFVSAAMRVHGATFEPSAWPAGIDDLAGLLGLTLPAFWREIDRFEEQHGFWSRLKAYPWVTDLVAMAEPFGFTVATSPSRDPFCASGKIQWLKRHLGESFGAFMVGPQKELLAAPGRVLIDDRDESIERFQQAGGQGILFPQPWNTNHGQCENRLAWVWKELQRYQSA